MVQEMKDRPAGNRPVYSLGSLANESSCDSAEDCDPDKGLLEQLPHRLEDVHTLPPFYAVFFHFLCHLSF